VIRFDAGSLRVTMRAFDTARATERQAAEMAVARMGRTLHAAIRQNVSLRDHSLRDLAELDHPYARRHGAIRIHRSGAKTLNDPANRVHVQSGRLLDALRAATTANGLGFRVWLDTGAAPHAAFVVQGTRIMLPRDVLWDTASSPEVRKRMMRDVVRTLGKSLRTKGGIRFGSSGPPANATGTP
jgi:hypothetical protein